MKLDKALVKQGVKEPSHQKILLATLPCGIESAKECLEDSTNVQVNAPRALMVCYWTGMVKAFSLLERKKK